MMDFLTGEREREKKTPVITPTRSQRETEREKRREEQRQSVFSPCYYVRGIITTYSVKKRG